MRSGEGFCRKNASSFGLPREVKNTPKSFAFSGVPHMPRPRMSTSGNAGNSRGNRMSVSPLTSMATVCKPPWARTRE